MSVIYGLVSAESGGWVERGELARLCQEWDQAVSPAALQQLFTEGERASLEQFSNWVDRVGDTELGLARSATFRIPHLT